MTSISNKFLRNTSENGSKKVSNTLKTIQRRIQFEDIVNKLKIFETEQLQTLDLHELKNGQLVVCIHRIPIFE